MPVTVSDITSHIEQFAPREWQESWDNSGLQIGNPHTIVHGVLLALDITPAIIDQAIESGANMIISHHPLLFRGLKNIIGATDTQRMVETAIRHNIALYSCHTNIDSAPGGVNSRLADILGITEHSPLCPSDVADPTVGIGRVGVLNNPITVGGLLDRLKTRLAPQVKVIRHTRLIDTPISRIALCGGSGAEYIPAAIASGAQAYITADMKYHDFQTDTPGIILIDIGHYESEVQVLEIFYELICKKFPNFAVRFSASGSNPINYYF